MAEAREERVLVLAPLGRDGALAVRALRQAGIEAETRPSLAALLEAVGEGAGAILLTEEGALDEGLDRLRDRLATQEPWSALPLVLLTSRETSGPAATRALRTIESLESVTFLERPVRMMTLISTIRASLDSRRRQYVLRDLLRRLEGQIRQRDEFLALLGHELRNPLAAIRNATELLKGDPKRGAFDTAVGILDRQGRNLSRMVDELLDVSRVTRGKIRLAREPIEIAGVLRQSVSTFAEGARERRVTLDLTVDEGDHVVRADETRLEQVFSNLIHNALKFSRPEGHVHVALDASDGRARVRVRDDGIGMDRQDLERVFDMFAQAKRSLDRAPGGLGIGLTLVRRLVEMHEGTIAVESEGLGLGSEFTVELPLVGAAGAIPEEPEEPEKAAEEDVRAPAARAARPPSDLAGGGDLSVLLVEDNPDIAESMSLLLEASGYSVRIEAEGEAALRAVEESRPDVVLLDIGLPGVDGFEVARRIRARPDGEGVRLIAITGYGQQSDRSRAARAGIDEFLVKPVRTDALLDLLAEEASAHAGARERPGE